MVALAGVVAQRLFNPRTFRTLHGDSDHREVLAYVGHLMRENETEPFLDWMEVRTDNLLRDNWKAVEMLAEKLICRQTISGEEAHEIIRTAPFEPNWDRGTK